MTWPMNTSIYGFPWDYGVRWYIRKVADPTEQVVDMEYVRDKHLRVSNGTVDNFYIDNLIAAATMMAERMMRRALAPQTWAWVADRLPTGEIVLDMPPLIEVLSFAYTDESGATATLDADQYQVSAPSGPMAPRGRIAPVASTSSWPSILSGTLEAVTVTFRAGYQDDSSPPVANVPEDIKQGILLLVGEMYKQRSESVVGFGTSMTPALVRARDIFMAYKVY